jgi:hypothetical protein
LVATIPTVQDPYRTDEASVEHRCQRTKDQLSFLLLRLILKYNISVDEPR